MFFDTHAHYEDSRFDEDREELLAGLPGRGVGLVVDCGSDIPSSLAARDMAMRYANRILHIGPKPQFYDLKPRKEGKRNEKAFRALLYR